MTGARPGVLLVTIVIAGVAAGCTSVSSGDPSPAGSATVPTSQDTTSAPQTRPREIKLDNVDPCSLLPEADYADYYLDKRGEPGKDDRGATNCLWQGDIGYMGVTLVTFEGIEAQEGRLGQIEPTKPIEEFPAFTVSLPEDENSCFVSVDVADGEYLDVQVGLHSYPKDIPPICEYAHQFATSIMSSLVKQ